MHIWRGDVRRRHLRKQIVGDSYTLLLESRFELGQLFQGDLRRLDQKA